MIGRSKKGNLTGAKGVLLLAVILTSFSSILIRLTTGHPLGVSFYRMFFALILTLGVSLFSRVLAGRASASKGSVKRKFFPDSLSRKDLALALLAGLFLGGHFATWISSLRYTTVASSVVLVSTHPLFILLLGPIFLGEKVSKKEWLYIILVLLGTGILSYGDFHGSGGSLKGNLLALGGAFFVALYFLIGKKLRPKIDLLPYTLLVYSCCTLFLLGMMALFSVSLAPPSGRELALYAALAFFCTLGGHTLYNYVLKFLPAALVSTSILLEPVVATLLAMLLFAEIPSLFSLAGAVCIVYGIWGALRSPLG